MIYNLHNQYSTDKISFVFITDIKSNKYILYYIFEHSFIIFIIIIIIISKKKKLHYLSINFQKIL